MRSRKTCRRIRGRWLAASWLGPLAILALIAGCQHPPPPPPVVAPAPAPPPPPPPPKPRRYTASGWSLRVTEQACIARASGRALTFSATVGPQREISLVMDLGRANARPGRGMAAELRFDGETGAWRAPARLRGSVVSATLPLAQPGLNEMLALLDGGQLTVSSGDQVLPGLNLPDAGVAGRDWFACPRARLAQPG